MSRRPIAEAPLKSLRAKDQSQAQIRTGIELIPTDSMRELGENTHPARFAGDQTRARRAPTLDAPKIFFEWKS
jgi:hypothetical protein